MMELYYDTEKPLPIDVDVICRKVIARSDDERLIVISLLEEFFKLTEEGYRHARCDEELINATAAMNDAKDRRQNEKERQQRNRERRKELFSKLREFDEIPPWNTSTETLLSRIEYHLSRVTVKYETSTEQVQTGPATANQYPIPNYQYPITNDHLPIETLDTVMVSPAADDDVRKCPVGSLVDLYHELMPENPRVKILNNTRKANIRQRWKEAAILDCQPFGYKTKSEGLAAWREFFKICSGSSFLIGLSTPQPDKPPFIADIDFIFRPSKFACILENKYHREKND